MNKLAQDLNAILEPTVAGRLLSTLGRRLYFPNGIISQSAEAKVSAHTANATIGMAFENGKPMVLSAIAQSIPSLKPEDIVAYAPTAGIEPLRKAWKSLLLEKNPSLDGEKISLPVVVPGITSGISYAADLFLDTGQSIIASDPCWDNYTLIFTERRGAVPVPVVFFNAGPGLNMAAIGSAIREAAKTGTVRIILNFPNNPAGYSPTKSEEEVLSSLLLESAEKGTDILVLCDDAYFGLNYEDTTSQESLFGLLSTLHERIFAVKIDGPTKEDYVWGLRIGFLTFGSKGLNDRHYNALIKKLMGAIRSSVSCANTSAQYLTLKAMADPRSEDEKNKFQDTLKERYLAVKRAVKAATPHPVLSPLPFNSGYFMSFRCIGVNAGELRKELLDKHGIGTIALGEDILRIAFSSVDTDKIPTLYQVIYATAATLAQV
ncbi:aminotransferase class I/II-fold pyridoxal phosphate-dependent enzyme [Breznakiellaceae bacterium SP9]